MKIALVILHADPRRGGAERYTIDLATALRQRGHDVSLLASSFGEQRKAPADVLLSARGATRAGRYLRFLHELDEHLESAHYDIVHAMLPVRRCDLYHPHAGIAAEAIASGHLKYRGSIQQAVAKTANRLNRRRRLFARIERELLTSDDPPVVLCLSQYIKQFVRKHYSLPLEKLVTLFNAVDLQKFDPSKRPDAGKELRRRFNIADEKVVALFLAQDFERKGLREAIAATARIDNPNFILLVAGKEDPQVYRDFAKDTGADGQVIFAGHADYPYAFYRAADFLVLPTRHDPCSLVVLEALAMGVPVISTVLNGACEIMNDGQHGFVLSDPSDIAALAAAMRQVLDRQTRAAMATQCLLLRPRLSFERHMDQLVEIYRAGSEKELL